jgi:hypothetical protein
LVIFSLSLSLSCALRLGFVWYFPAAQRRHIWGQISSLENDPLASGLCLDRTKARKTSLEEGLGVVLALVGVHTRGEESCPRLPFRHCWSREFSSRRPQGNVLYLSRSLMYLFPAYLFFSRVICL